MIKHGFRGRTLTVLLVLTLAICLIPSVALATTADNDSSSANSTVEPTKAPRSSAVYLDPKNGDDINSGEDAANAVETIQKAVELAGEGGTIIVESTVTIDAPLNLSNITIQRSADMQGTLLYVISDLTLTNVIVDGGNTSNTMPLANIREDQGRFGKLTMNKGTVFRNTHGTPIRVFMNGTFTMNGGEISGNEVTDTWGMAGAIDLDQCYVYLNGGEIKNNSAPYAGAVRVGGHGGWCIVDGTKIHENTGNYGGAFFVQGMWNYTGAPSPDANLVIKSGEVTNNSAIKNGGAIYAAYNGYETNIQIDGGVIKDNLCKENSTSSAVYLSTTSNKTGACDFAVSGSPTIEGSIYLMQTTDKVSTIHVTNDFTPTSPLHLYSSSLTEEGVAVHYEDGVSVNPAAFFSEHEGWGLGTQGQNLVWRQLKIVSFESEDGATVYGSAYANADGFISTDDVPSLTPPAGYQLAGWKLKGSDELWDFDSDKISADNKTLIAVWALKSPNVAIDARKTKVHEGSNSEFELVATPSHEVNNVQFSYTWMHDNKVIDGETNAVLKTSEPGVYTVSVTATDGNLVSSAVQSEGIKCSIEPHATTETWSSDSLSHWKVCEICGAKFECETHSWSEWEVTEQASATSDGVQKRICEICGFEESKTIKMLKDDSAEDGLPATGDFSSILIIALGLISLLALTFVVLSRKKISR